MNSNSNKDSKVMSLKEALDLIDEIPQNKKNRLNDYLKIFEQYQKQKGIKPDDLLDLLSKGVSSFPKEKFRLLMHIFAENIKKSRSNPLITAFVLEECIAQLRKIGYSISVDTISTDFIEIIHKERSEPESIKSFIREIQKKNAFSGANKETPDNVFSLIYMFLTIMIDYTYKIDSKRKEVLLEMERSIVEEALRLPDKDLSLSICRFVPNYLLKGNYDSYFSSMCYLFYDFKAKSQSLTADVIKKQEQITYLNNDIEQKNNSIIDLKASYSGLTEENEKLKEELQHRIAEKEEAEDRLEFETNRIERQYRSQTQGLAKKYNSILGLEIEGIEDIIQFLPDDAKKAIQERIDRMRQIITEIGGS